MRSFLSILSLIFALQIVTASGRAAPDAEAGTPEPSRLVFGVAPAGEADLAPFRLEIVAGATIEATLNVSNEGDAPVELRSYATDIATGINGGYVVLPVESDALEEAAWLAIPADAYVVEPGQTHALTFQVTVPDGTIPGEYMAALATQPTDSAALEGVGAFRQITRKVNAVVITVPGPVEAGFTIGAPVIELMDGLTMITAPIANTGNVRVRPAGTITIADPAGELIAVIPVAMNSVYAWHSTILQVAIPEALPAGDYLVAIVLADPATGASATLSDTEVTVQAAD